jgi:hypothetical protein
LPYFGKKEGIVILLIAGASHTGKTLAAQKLIEKYRYPCLSLDHLKMGLIRSGICSLTPESDERELTPYLWNIAREIIKTAVENQQNLIIEGCYIPFDWKKDFESRYQPHIHALWLIFSPEYIRRFYKNIRKYAHIIETRLTDHTDAPEIMIEENSYNLHMCRVHGCSYLRMDEKYDLSAVEHFPQTPENVSGIKENLDSGSENR